MLRFKFFLSCISIFLAIGTAKAQNCFVQLGDATGMTHTPAQLVDLEEAACELKASLPSEYQDSFIVFDLGFYRIKEYTENGLLTDWDTIIQDVQSLSNYYLLFGKAVDENIIYDVLVDYKLPQDSNECYGMEYFLNTTINEALFSSELNLYNYADREVAVMEALQTLNCEVCDNGIDDDGDGYIDCYDLDCIFNSEAVSNNRDVDSRNPGICYSLPEECTDIIYNFILDEESDTWLQEHLDVLDWGLLFMATYGCTEDVGSFIYDALNLKKNDEEINLDRVEELYLAMQNGPNALLENCPDYDLQTYADLLNLQVPNSIIDQLNSYGICALPTLGPHPPVEVNCFGLQGIEDGSSTLVNIDYYAVEVQEIPDFDNDGTPDTKERLYQEFRKKFTDLVSGETTLTTTNCPSPSAIFGNINASWEFEPYESIDLNFWETRTIGARFFINANANALNALVADDGAIITIQENNFSFVVTTIYTPLSGSQPFSGKRMWGIRVNENGYHEIFTRAIDRAKPIPIVDLLGEVITECDDLDYFTIADETWKNFQTKAVDFIHQEGGVVEKKVPKVVHLDFEIIYDKLKSDTPVDFITCQ